MFTRLAVQHDLVHELPPASFEHLADAVEDLSAVVCTATGPAAHRTACGDHRIAHILAAAAAHVRQRFAIGALRLIIAPALGARELPADEDLVGLHHREAFALLRSAVAAVAVQIRFDDSGLGDGLAHGPVDLRSQS